MPKVCANEFERKIYAFRRWFKGKRSMENIRLVDLARKMGVSHTAVSRKINPKGDRQTDITYEDLLLFFREVNASDEEILRYMKMDERGSK